MMVSSSECPPLLKVTPSSMPQDEEECCVCLNETRSCTPCGHRLCRFCWRRVQTSSSPSCPICRGPLPSLAPPKVDPRELLASISKVKTFAEVERLASMLPQENDTADAALARSSLLRRASQLLEAQSLQALCAHSRVILWLLNMDDAGLRASIEGKLQRALREVHHARDLAMVVRVARIAVAEPYGLGKAIVFELQGSCERVLAHLAAPDFRDETVLKHLTPIAKVFPAMQTLVCRKILQLSSVLEPSPAESAAPYVLELVRSLGALVQEQILDGNHIPDEVLASLAIRLNHVLGPMTSETSAAFLSRCSGEDPSLLGPKLERVLQAAAVHHVLGKEADATLTASTRNATQEALLCSSGELPCLSPSRSNSSLGRSSQPMFTGQLPRAARSFTTPQNRGHQMQRTFPAPQTRGHRMLRKADRKSVV